MKNKILYKFTFVQVIVIILIISIILSAINIVYAEESTITYPPETTLEVSSGVGFGARATDNVTSICPTSDGGYLACGTFNYSITIGDKTLLNQGIYDTFVIKFNANNEIASAVSFGGTGSDYGYSICTTNDGGYAVCGNFTGTLQVGNKLLESKGGADVFVIKFNANNEIVNAISFGGTGLDIGFSICQTSDSGYAVCGYFADTMQVGNTFLESKGSQDAFIVKLNANYEIENAVSFGGTGFDQAKVICNTKDNGYIIGGRFNNTMQVGDQLLESKGGFDAFIVKFNANNEIVNAISFGSTGSDITNGICQTNDGGYAICGDFAGTMQIGDTTLTNNNKTLGYVVKLNKNYEIINAISFGSSYGGNANSICQTRDGGYAICGNFIGNKDEIMEVGDTTLKSNGGSDILVIKFNVNNEIANAVSIGGVNAEIADTICQTSDGGYAIGGNYTSGIMQVGNNTLKRINSEDALVAKLNSYELETKVKFNKKDKDTNTNLQNAKFIVKNSDNKYYIDALNFGDKSKAKVFTSDENGDFEINFKVKGTYYLEEIESPSGYRKNDNSYTIEIKEIMTSEYVVTYDGDEISLEDGKYPIKNEKLTNENPLEDTIDGENVSSNTSITDNITNENPNVSTNTSITDNKISPETLDGRGDSSDNPKTGDAIHKYYIMLLISLIGIYLSIKVIVNITDKSK